MLYYVISPKLGPLQDKIVTLIFQSLEFSLVKSMQSVSLSPAEITFANNISKAAA